MCGETPQAVSSLDLLGILVDKQLTFQPLLDKGCSRLQQGARDLSSAMESAGFGIPYTRAQFGPRVESSALF